MANGNSTAKEPKKKALTFADKMAARRKQGGVETATMDSGSFSSRFASGGPSRFGGGPPSNGNNMNGGRFQDSSRPPQRPQSSGRFDDRSNSNSKFIRPRANE